MNCFKEYIGKIAKKHGVDIENVRGDYGTKEFVQRKCDVLNQGEGKLNEYDEYDCPKCKNKGIYFFPKKDNNSDVYDEHSTTCECMEIRKTIRYMKKSGFENLAIDYTFDNYTTDEDWQKNLKNKAMEFVEDNKKAWFFIGGTSGCGKTHLCAAICRPFLLKGVSTQYMVWRDEAIKLKSSVNDYDRYSRYISKFKNAKVLYIDDLFKTGRSESTDVARPTPADINLAFELINYRYMNKNLKTIISSEMTIKEIDDIDEAIAGRIIEMSFKNGYGFNIPKDKSKNYRKKFII